MLVPLRPGELNKLIPAVASSDQFRSALGNPQKILQRVMISSIGGIITLLIYGSQVGSSSSIWLVIGVCLLLYLLWGPILEASQMNAQLRRYPSAALFDGNIRDVFTKERVEKRHEQANKLGQLELVESRRTWMIVELEDEDGYLGKISFPMDKKHQLIREGLRIRCLALSHRKDFSRIDDLSDAWIPSHRIWIGEYPFLLRPAFEELCSLRLTSRN